MKFLLTSDKVGHLLLIGCFAWILSDLCDFLGLFDGWLTFITIWLTGGIYAMTLAVQMVSTKGKAVLITGCDSGFGYSLALQLDRLGFRVFAGCLLAEKGGEGATSLREKGSKKLHVIQMDVTNEDEIKAAKQTVEMLLPNNEVLWGLVNNAGLANFGMFELLPISEYKRIQEVNIYGMIGVTRVFLPILRKSKGRIVNVSSVSGRFGGPFSAPYTISKYAVEGFSDCLRVELKMFGLKIILIEPGLFIAGTNLLTADYIDKCEKEILDTISDDTKSVYNLQYIKKPIGILKSFKLTGNPNIQPVIDAFVEALTQRYPQARYQPMHIYFRTRVFISTHLPEWIYDAIYL